MRIVDCTGQLVCRLAEGSAVWNGTSEQGQAVGPGTYLYCGVCADTPVRGAFVWAP
jgi:hypothetical protein